MPDNDHERPDCFGELDTVFPAGDGGIRTTPPECMKCPQVKACIQTAMLGQKGLELEEERVDRAYEYGLIGVMERWSRKKSIRKKMEALASRAGSKKKPT
jgi:hypothetical protein